MSESKNLSGNNVSRVHRGGLWVYKSQPKFLTDNEIWCFQQMKSSGYVPDAEQVSMETIRTLYIENEPVTDATSFLSHVGLVLSALRAAGIRHGDLTEYSILVKDNRPYLIDFAESRLWEDPRLDKRREGDVYWIRETMNKLSTG